MPITVISTSGSVVHMRPLPSDSTTPTVPVSATAKFAPLIPTRTARNFSRRCRRPAPDRQELLAQGPARRLGQRRGLVADRGRAGQPGAEQVADLGAVAVDRS